MALPIRLGSIVRSSIQGKGRDVNSKNRRTLYFVGAVLFVACFAGVAQGQMARQREPLKGLSGFGVYVSGDDWLLSDSQLRLLVELRLRQAGVQIAECKSPKVCVPHLYVELKSVKRMDDLTWFSIKIECNYVVASITDSKRQFLATVWLSQDSGITLRNESDVVRKKLIELVEIFLNDYLAANPKTTR
jgi:hypothetical protein